ncbi:polysaccharide deacetylase family protein [Oscillospiraceae bacterium PP1C4]
MSKDVNDGFDYPKKNRRKIKRTIFQIVFLVLFTAIAINAAFYLSHYQPLDSLLYNSNDGFVAISYLGVDRTQKATLIDNDMLSEQLSALKASGFETISQQDILNYYHKGTPLPKKALYLCFEDGRKDSGMFAQPILEKLNYKATMFTYANKFAIGDLKFLMPKDLMKMEKSSFWELGSNGYRFEYINVFDRFGNFLNILNQDQFHLVAKYMQDDYNHYLMDFIRDKNRIPTENRTQMEQRISWDYEQMRTIYTQQFGKIPQVYMLMHADGLYGNANRLITDANDREIKKTFQLHFNREGKSLNTAGDDLYNLTRLQPQPYWYTNHLLMRLWEDTGGQMAFQHGDETRAKQWEVLNGQAEFVNSKMILTSPPAQPGYLYLKGSEEFQDFKLSASLEGNVVGEQSIYLRCNADRNAFLRVVLKDNELSVEQKTPNTGVQTLFTCNLRELDAQPAQSIPQVALEAGLTEAQLKIKTSESTAEKKQAQEAIVHKKNAAAPTVEDGAEEFVPSLNAGQLGKRAVVIEIKSNTLAILVDGKTAVQGLEFDQSIKKGSLGFEACASERNTKDRVYDAVFENLFVQALPKAPDEEGEMLFDSRLKGFEKAWAMVTNHYDQVVDWFIETF